MGAPTAAPTVAPTVTTGTIKPRVETGSSGSSDSSGSGSSPGWLLPLLLGLLTLCCLAALIGYFCMQKPKKASKRATKVKKPTPAPAPVVAPQPEAAPLVSGHWEQPMMMEPVYTTTQSYTPMAAPTYGMTPTMAAPLYGTSQIV